ncbi:MAG TPA: DmsC/YnfH family molybdoenzyme membrane anchor subunit [Opitutaceae bacterium]|nr:DmsC/YnfH family molybdoenzyme membrane anchor subunit [Opitutaceae bacterium]
MVAPQKNFSLIDELLAEQQQLQTPVARFARAAGGSDTARNSAPSVQLIPLTAPGPGEQYAFEVDLDACSGCKACVAACHSLNGLDEHETWRDTGLLVGGDESHPFQQIVTTACHHCADPACLHGCPVLAYEKDPLTGIVRHLDDQCIGCTYCVLKCPYDVPKYNPARGIVRKCDMCQSRLAHAEAPACAQACPTHAIRIVAVHTADLPATFLPGAPEPGYTRPTTRYVTQRRRPGNLRSADADVLRPQPAHWPLGWMLVLTQVSIGLLAAATARPGPSLRIISWGAAAIGLGASVLHLGQPLKAWRCFLGLRRSWLSREIVVFAAYFILLSVLAMSRHSQPALEAAALAAGAAGVFSSAMVYADTRRSAWRLGGTAGKFFGTALIAGLIPAWPAAAAVALGAKLFFENAVARETVATARLWRGPLRTVVRRRLLLGVSAALALAAGLTTTGFFLFAAGELAERYLFFRTVDAPKMPGLPAP